MNTRRGHERPSKISDRWEKIASLNSELLFHWRRLPIYNQYPRDEEILKEFLKLFLFKSKIELSNENWSIGCLFGKKMYLGLCTTRYRININFQSYSNWTINSRHIIELWVKQPFETFTSHIRVSVHVLANPLPIPLSSSAPGKQ